MNTRLIRASRVLLQKGLLSLNKDVINVQKSFGVQGIAVKNSQN